MQLWLINNNTDLVAFFGLVVGVVLFWYIIQRSNQKEEHLKTRSLSDEECIKFFNNKQKTKTENPDDIYNLTKVNYLHLLNNIVLKGIAEACVRKYSIADYEEQEPQDHHLLEIQLAKFMGVEEAIVYSYGFGTISSVIVAYCKRPDYIFCDEKIGPWARQGIYGSTSHVCFFKHNNANDLERKLRHVHSKAKRNRKVIKKFVIVEGLYSETGTICSLPDILIICKQYKAKMFLDESKSFAILGDNGRGITEYYGIHISNVDLIVISAEGSLGLVGGFCLGSSYVIKHQKFLDVSGCAAPLPPYMCRIMLGAINMFNIQPDMFNALRGLSLYAHRKLKMLIEWEILSDPISPMKVLRLRNGSVTKLNHIHKYCTDNNLMVMHDLDKLRMHLHLNLTNSDVEDIVRIIISASKYVA